MVSSKKKKNSVKHILSLSVLFLGLITIWFLSKKTTLSSCCSEPLFESNFDYSQMKGTYEKEEVKEKKTKKQEKFETLVAEKKTAEDQDSQKKEEKENE